jgi:cyclopropane fatty-acyl-phospholipid synthase-like methyltransferase
MMVVMSGDSYEPEEHYDRVTKAWNLLLGDELHYGVFERGDESLAAATAALTDRMLEAAAIEAGGTILDVGCGTGTQSCRIAQDHAAHVTGITTSAVGVAEARARAAGQGLEASTDFEQRSGTDNGFADASFDRVWVLESSHLMPDREQLIAECCRVLRPGGRLALCDIVLQRPMPFSEVRRLREPLMLLREVFGAARMEPLALYVEHVEQNGLTVDATMDLTTATRPTFDRWQANAATHREAVVDLLDERSWQAFVDSCDVLRGFWDDGTLGYGLLAAHVA